MPTDKSKRQLKSLATRHGLSFDKPALKAEPYSLAGRKTNVQILYNGGSLISRLLDDSEIALAQLGCDGKWTAILPIEALLKLLEIESLKSVAGADGPRSTQTLQ